MSRRPEDADGYFRYANDPVPIAATIDRCVNCGKPLAESGSLDLFCSEDCRSENPTYVHFEYAPCVFCKIASQTESTEDLIRHCRGVLSFTPKRPVTAGHRIFIPHQHVIDAAHFPSITGEVFAVAAAYAAIERREFNLITSAGRAATQNVSHLHVHYVPREEDDGLLLPWSEF